MAMPVMNVWVVSVTMNEFLMQVRVAVGLMINLIWAMFVMVMDVVNMAMIVVEGFVCVNVFMPFCYAQQNSNCHGYRTENEELRYRFAPDQQSTDCSYKGS